MMRVIGLLACFWVTACAPPGPPRDLEGLWSRSDGACRIGAGIRFGADAVRIFYGRSDEVLFDAPRYRVERRGAVARIAIAYRRPNDAPSAAARTLILERDEGDSLRPARHGFADGATGSVRIDLDSDDLQRAMTLRRCPDPSD